MNENKENITTAVIFADEIGSFPDDREDNLKFLAGKIGGLTTFQRVVLSLRKEGIKKIVALGLNEHLIDGIRDKRIEEMEIKFIDDGNRSGINRELLTDLESALQGDDKFYFISSASVFDPNILSEMSSSHQLLNRFKAVMALHSDGGDEGISPGFSLDKNDQRVLSIEGKQAGFIRSPGIFLCGFSILDVWKNQIETGSGEKISELMESICQEGQLGYCGISNAFMRHMGSAEDFKKAEKAVFKSLEKETDGFLAHHINRKISIFITRLIAGTRVTPNQMTFMTLAVGLTGALSFSMGGYYPALMGALMFQFSSIIDGCDGELARLKFLESRFGGWLDIFCDNITHVAVFAGIAYGEYRIEQASYLVYCGYLAVFGTIMSFSLVAWQLYKKESAAGPFFTSVLEGKEEAGKDVENITQLQDNLARRDFTYLLIIFALLGYSKYFLVLVGVGSNLFWLSLVYSRIKIKYF